MWKKWITKLRNQKAEILLYQLGILGLVLLIMGYVLYLLVPFPQIPCQYYEVAGVYCPGCGGTRSVIHFLHGEFVRSFLKHPFVPYGIILYLWFMISHTLSFLTHGKIRGLVFRTWYIYVGVAIILVQWIVKNVLLLVFDIIPL